VSSHDRVIGFVGFPFFEMVCDDPGSLGVEGEDQDASDRFVESMHRINAPSQLVSKEGHGVECLVSIDL